MGQDSPRQQSIATAGETVVDRGVLPFGQPMLSDRERAAVMQVLHGPILTHGPRVQAFESAFAAFTDAPHAIATSTCTASLHLAYMSLGLVAGDEVIVPAMSHVATAHAVELCSGRCVFVDAEPLTGNIDIDLIERSITPRTRAICVVHFLGMPVDMARVCRIAEKHDLFVIEDCALALGARYRGDHVGLSGDIGCFSFYPAKHITTGEGGMTITRRDDLAQMTAQQRAFGIDRNIISERTIPGEYDVESLGANYRMTEMAAAIGVEQMRRLGGFLQQRRENYEILSEGLREIQEIETLTTSHGPFDSAFYCHCIVLDDSQQWRRGDIIEYLKLRGIGTSIYYPKPIPMLSWYRQNYGHRDEDFPVASRISAASIALPVGPHLNGDDMRYIVAVVKEAIRSELI